MKKGYSRISFLRITAPENGRVTAEPNELTAEELSQLEQELKAIDEEYSTRVRIPEEDPSLLDSAKKAALDTFDTSAALLETAAKETVNLGTKIGANVGATALGAIHGVREGSLDEGISAMRSVRDETMGRYRIESSDFAKEQLSQSVIAEIAAWVQEKGEAAYSVIEEKYGTNVAELVKGSLGAGLDVAAVLGTGAIAKTVSYEVNQSAQIYKAVYQPARSATPGEIAQTAQGMSIVEAQMLTPKKMPVEPLLDGYYPELRKVPSVVAEVEINGKVFRDANQSARAVELYDVNKSTEISAIIEAKMTKSPKKFPNGNMATAHAEIGVLQQLHDTRLAKGQRLEMTVKGRDVCSHCKSDIGRMAKEMEIESLTIHATDRNSSPITYYWEVGMKGIKKMEGDK